jgi:hypothetical protein
MKKNKKNNYIIFIFLLFLLFFSFSVIIAYDTSHYMTYVKIFEGLSPFSEWDIVRGPIFPLILFLSNVLFGKSPQGMLVCMFIFYLIFVYVVWKILNEIFYDSDNKKQKIIKWILFLFCILNPINFGYAHTMLTEFVAIPLILVSVYFSWKWITNDNHRVLYSLIFTFLILFSWHLKQPYICFTFFPLLVSMFINFFTKQNKKWYYPLSVLVSLIVLIISIISWNAFLIYKKVDMNSGRDSSTMLSGQIIKAVNSVDSISYELFLENKINLLDKTENEVLTKEKNNTIILNIYNNDKLVDQDILLKNYSTTDAVKEIINLFYKHPIILLRSYEKNTCGISSLCQVGLTGEGTELKVYDTINYTNLFENKFYAYRLYQNNISNDLNLPENVFSRIEPYSQTIHSSIFSKIFIFLEQPTSILYKIFILISPLTFLILLFYGIFCKKNMQRKKTYYLGLILSITSILTTLSFSLVYLIIDRYSVELFIPNILCFVLCLSLIFQNNKGKKRSKKIREKKDGLDEKNINNYSGI